MNNNPETLKYKIGQQVVWKDNIGEKQEGQVINVVYKGLEVVKQDGSNHLVRFDCVIQTA